MRNINKNNFGFTLIELIVVIAIMGVILILALPQVSKIQSANKNKKYEAYKESIEAAAKIYIDNHSKDIFGNNTVGCVTISYSDLEKDYLIKDFGETGVDCGDDDQTFVDVVKNNNTYTYSTDLVCYKESKEVFKSKDSDKPNAKVCENHGGDITVPDSDPPILDIEPDDSGEKWYNAERIYSVLKLKVIVSDQNGLNSNLAISLTWNQVDGDNTEFYSYNFKNPKMTEEDSKISWLIPVNMIPNTSEATGKYKLTISPDNANGWGIQDALGNVKIGSVSEEEYWIDNTPPTMSPTISSSSTSYNTLNTTITMNGNDNIGMDKVYISNTGYEKGGSWQDYSNKIKWNVGGDYDGETRTIYITLKDVAGNKVNQKLTYKVYKECSSQVDGGWQDTSTCSKSCGPGKKDQKKTYSDKYLTGVTCKVETRTTDCNLRPCVSASVINRPYNMICPEDQLKPTRSECESGRYNALVIENVSVSGVYVTVSGYLQNNATYVTWNASDPNRTVCIANTSNTCIHTLCTFSVADQSYAAKGSTFCSFYQTVDVSMSQWTAGQYRIIVKSGGGSQKWSIMSTPYMINLFSVTK